MDEVLETKEVTRLVAKNRGGRGIRIRVYAYVYVHKEKRIYTHI